MRRVASRSVVAWLVVASASAFVSRARAQHDGAGSCERPLSEISTWLSLGGGALGRGEQTRGFFDMRLGADWTLPLHEQGDRRFGPWLEVATSSFATFSAAGGVELFLGAAPKPFHLFQYDGEGVLSLRAGTGWVFRRSSFPGATDSPIGSVTLAWGYRAPWELWDSWACECADPSPTDISPRPCRRPARYMTVVRFYVTAQRDFAADGAWQISGGLELEPLGSFRYLLGLY